MGHARRQCCIACVRTRSRAAGEKTSCATGPSIQCVCAAIHDSIKETFVAYPLELGLPA
mgnify:CR=1 FL=1